jgi:hypothetical protein
LNVTGSNRAPKHIGEKLLAGTPYGVEVRGVDVCLTIGGRSILLQYDDANKIAVFLRYAAKVAKRRAGDYSLKILGVADLTDANSDELELQANRSATAVFSRAKR